MNTVQTCNTLPIFSAAIKCGETNHQVYVMDFIKYEMIKQYVWRSILKSLILFDILLS